MAYVNISGYQFKELNDLEALQNTLKTHCRKQNLKGTILLSPEGINCFLSGERPTIDAFYEYIKEKGFTDIDFKESISDNFPFKRMLVKIKPEIITMGIPGFSPLKMRAPYVSAQTFKSWLESGEEIVIFDTRNDYEVTLGKFANAIHLDIEDFKSFPEAIKSLPPEMKKKKIVTYCTGGIRAEKAAPYLIQEGFSDVYQLEGGILKYFEQCGRDYYEGECFVFDKRIAINHELKETPTKQCYVCRQPVTLEDQNSLLYKEGQYCPRCVTPEKSLS